MSGPALVCAQELASKDLVVVTRLRLLSRCVKA